MAKTFRDILVPASDWSTPDLVLEGGYHLSLADGVHSLIEVLAGGDAPLPPEPGVDEAAEVAEFHLRAFKEDD